MNNINDILELIKTGKNDQLEEVLKDDPALSGSKTADGISLLQFAAYCRNDFAISLIKEYNQPINIYEAASIGDIDNVMINLKQDPTLLNAYSADGFTPLGLASYFGHYDIVKILLEKGADPDLASNNLLKVTPLHSACSTSNFDIARLLIEFNANVNTRQMEGVTPLHSAAHNGHMRLTQLLIASGAELNAKMDNGKTPVFMAIENGHIEIAELLRKYSRKNINRN